MPQLFLASRHGRTANDNQSGVFLQIAAHLDHGLKLGLKRIIIRRGQYMMEMFCPLILRQNEGERECRGVGRDT